MKSYGGKSSDFILVAGHSFHYLGSKGERRIEVDLNVRSQLAVGQIGETLAQARRSQVTSRHQFICQDHWRLCQGISKCANQSIKFLSVLH